MNLEELSNLISIRNYIEISINNNNTIDKKTINYLNGILPLVDKKIILILLGDEFKDYINYNAVQQDIINTVQLKSGLSKFVK